MLYITLNITMRAASHPLKPWRTLQPVATPAPQRERDTFIRRERDGNTTWEVYRDSKGFYYTTSIYIVELAPRAPITTATASSKVAALPHVRQKAKRQQLAPRTLCRQNRNIRNKGR